MARQINVLNEKSFERLRLSIEWSNRQLEFPKTKRLEAIREFAGFHYSEDSSPKRVPVPFLKMAVGIYIRLLAARSPSALITTKKQDLKSTAANLELAINEIPKEIKLQSTLKELVLEALFSFGIAKVGLADSGELLGHRVGKPFVDVVTMDDFIIDMSAKNFSQIQYIGNQYWMDYEEIMEGGFFPKNRIRGMEADKYTVIDRAGEERAEGISQDTEAQLFKEKKLLRDVWIPDDGVFATYAVEDEKLLIDTQWKGPELGPYHILAFDKVPGNLLPVPPVSIWRDLHELGNSLYRKISHQADSQKTTLGFSGGDDEGVKAFQTARDGDGIRYKGGKPERLTAGGVDPATLAFFINTKDIFSYFAGNLDSLGGLGVQSDTVGQDKLISAASSAQLKDMASEVIDFSRDLFRALAYYEWHDLFRTRELERPIPGTDVKLVVPWNRDSRRGAFDAYDLDIDVFSLQDDSPSAKLQKISLVWQQWILPMLPFIQQAGGQLNAKSVLETVAKYADVPEVAEMIQFYDGFSTDEVGNKETTKSMPSNTTRTNVRVNRPGASDRGKSQILQQTLLGSRPQQSETASLTRPSG